MVELTTCKFLTPFNFQDWSNLLFISFELKRLVHSLHGHYKKEDAQQQQGALQTVESDTVDGHWTYNQWAMLQTRHKYVCHIQENNFLIMKIGNITVSGLNIITIRLLFRRATQANVIRIFGGLSDPVNMLTAIPNNKMSQNQQYKVNSYVSSVWMIINEITSSQVSKLFGSFNSNAARTKSNV